MILPALTSRGSVVGSSLLSALAATSAGLLSFGLSVAGPGLDGVTPVTSTLLHGGAFGLDGELGEELLKFWRRPLEKVL